MVVTIRGRARAGGTGARYAAVTVQRPVPVPAEPDERMVAMAEEAGWDEAQIEAQFAKFVNFNRAKGNAWADWSHPWQSWVKRSIERERKSRSVRSTSGTSVVDRMLSHAADVAKFGYGEYAA
jgi:hypothetical protein